MRNTKIKYIKCPYCGTEYLPAEIFLPKTIVGDPKDIEKSDTGEIISYSDTTYDITEKYICDRCNKAFKIKARLFFDTEKDLKNDFNDDYCSVKSKQLSLFETNDTDN